MDSKELYNEIEQYLKQIDPELMSRVHLYAEATPLFDKFDIESEIRDLFKARVELPTGGSLIIQPTEALISIDVNTGRYTGKKDPEKTILRTNLEAAREIARQIRLARHRRHHRLRLHRHGDPVQPGQGAPGAADHLGRDRARTKALAVSELGLVEMTRQRVRPALALDDDRLPRPAGSGRVFTPEVVSRRLERALKRAARAPGAPADGPAPSRGGAIPAGGGAQAAPDPSKLTGLDLELRDDPMMRLDEFRLMSRPAGRDVTELYAVKLDPLCRP